MRKVKRGKREKRREELRKEQQNERNGYRMEERSRPLDIRKP